MWRRLLAIAVLAFLGCDRGGDSGSGEARPQVAPPRLSPIELLPPIVDRQPTRRFEVRNPVPVPATQVDLFRQSPGVVDILWVIDNSGSMRNERQTLGGNFDRFLQEILRVNTNFHIGVISSDAAHRGILRGTTRVITNTTPDPRSVFIANTTFPDSRVRWVNAMRMAQIAISAPLTDPGQPNEGFLRPNAALAVIFVGDKEDASYGDPSFYARFLRGIRGKGNENLVSFSSIAGTTPNGCFPPGEQIYYGGLAPPAFRLSSLATRTSGVVGSICDASFENSLVQIAHALKTLRRIFPLSLTPNPATITVLVNGVPIPPDEINGWQYRAETRSITFTGLYVPPPNSTIRIEYAIVI